MSKTLLEQFVANEARMRRFQQERAISETTGLILRAMELKGLRRCELAEKLGKTPGWVTQLLDGEGNKTIRTVADVLAVLGQELHVKCAPISIGPTKPVVLRIAPGTWADEGRQWPVRSLQTGLLKEG